MSTAIPTMTLESVEPPGTEGVLGAVSGELPVSLSSVDGVLGVDGVEGVEGVSDGTVAFPLSAATANVENPGEVASK